MVLTCGVLLVLASSCQGVLQEIVQWNLLSYNFPSNTAHKGNFRPENTVLTGLDIGYDRLFVAAPRLRPGVPATMATISRNTPAGSSPVLEAFPDWSWHDAGIGQFNCSGLISVYRIRSDRCNRLWVLDSGVMDSIDNFMRVCPPKMIIFDMKTMQPLRVIRFPDELVRPNSLFTNLIIDETQSTASCDDAFVYISDTAAPGMIVYDGKTDNAWRITHAAMYPDPDFSRYTIGEDQFELMDGIVGLGFSPNQGKVYFQPLATDRTFSISTAALQRGPPAEGEELPIRLVGRKSSQGLGISVDPFSDTLFYSPLTETAIASWNPITNHHEVLAYDPDRLQFAAEVRWAEKDGGSVWALTTRFQKFFLRTVSSDEINIRILRILPDYPQRAIQPLRYYRNVNATAVY
ncbi:dopaminechrome tautomerase-like [Arctopsyche grandis]|uniref:dopaminechrome tautomerase-like n=1 Tax=Arctopsyche grandis TaxID=121162 RepID=UPI00406D8D86